MKRIVNYSMLIILLNIVSCSKKEEAEETTPVQVAAEGSVVSDNNSTLVSNLNGFKFEAAYVVSDDVNYPYLWVQYIDDYHDSVRTVVLAQDVQKIMTKYISGNHYNGVMSSSFSHGGFPNESSKSMHFSFYHPSYLLQWYNRLTGEIAQRGTLFGFNTSSTNLYRDVTAVFI